MHISDMDDENCRIVLISCHQLGYRFRLMMFNFMRKKRNQIPPIFIHFNFFLEKLFVIEKISIYASGYL